MSNWFTDLFKSKPQDIWKNVKCEYLRDEDDWGVFGDSAIQTWHIYAIHQVSLNTRNKRIIELSKLYKIDEYDNSPSQVGYEDR